MRKHLISLALALCAGALFFPIPAYAATDSTPPSLDAWLSGDILQAEASDDYSGVEAVYVNGNRFGYLVDGAIEIAVKDYAGTEKHITVHALDFAGNKSAEVKLDNPYYKAPRESSASEAAPAGTTPAPTPSQAAQTSSSSQPQTTATSQTSASPTTSSNNQNSAATAAPSQTESAVPDDVDASDANAFTPAGTGNVQDNATEADGKEFFTITTESENTFYLVIDRQRDSDGVYLLNTVTENDLLALAEKDGSGTSGESAIPAPAPEPEPASEPAPDPEPVTEPEPEPESGGTSTGMIIFVIVIILGVGGAGYYLKVLKPRQNAALDTEDEDADDYDDDYDGEEYGDEYGSEPLAEDDSDEYEFYDTTEPDTEEPADREEPGEDVE